MRRAAVWLFSFIAFGVAVFIVVFLIQINPRESFSDVKGEDSLSHTSQKSGGEFESWISRFSTPEESDYFYPVNEVTLNLDMGNGSNPSMVYRLSVGPLDSDHLLLVKEELETHALPYDLQNSGETKLITVDSTDQFQLQTLVTKLKTYQIPATLSPYTEEY